MLKKLILIICFNLCLSGLQAAKTLLHCRFVSYPNTSYRIVNGQHALNDYAGITLKSGTTASDGNLEIDIDFESEGYAILFISNTFYRIWLAHGDLTIDQHEGELTFSGSIRWQNYFLYQSKFMQPYLIPGPLKYPKQQYPTFIRELDELQEIRLELLGKLTKEQKISIDFYNYMVSETLNGNFLAKNQYALLNGINQANAPKGFFDFWKNFKVLGDVPIQKKYFDALKDYIEFKVTPRHSNSGISKTDLIKKQFIFIDSALKERPVTNENLKGELILFLIKYFDDLHLIDSLSNSFAKNYANSIFTKPMLQLIRERKDRLKQKITFSLKDINGEIISVESFKGKLVYLDFWGSWCKACLEEMPAAKKLRNYFKGKDIIFAYIDFYDTKEIWLKSIKGNSLEDAINLKAEKGDEAYFNTYFGVAKGFPRYALLDRNGNLVSTTVSSPSKPETITYLESLVKK